MGAAIDALLGLMIQQGANELRVGTGRAPRILRDGTPKRLAMRETSDAELWHLIGELLSSEQEQNLRAGQPVEFVHDAGPLGPFNVTLKPRAGEGSFDAVFVPRLGRAASSDTSASAHRGVRPSADAPAAPTAPAMGEPGVASPAPVARAPDSGATAGASPAPGRELLELLARAVATRASDIHLCSGEGARVRVDGKLRTLELAGGVADTEQLFDTCLDTGARERLGSGASVDLALEVPALGRFRVNVYRTSNRLAAAVRLLPSLAPTLSSLRLPATLDDVIDLPQGLVIVCGPTGSGKTTTLAAIANEAIRRRSVVVLTLEDPVEFLLVPPADSSSIVRQRQIGRDVRDFATGLRDALREDPDVLVVGEMRDPESISLALTAAETGHLVLASLHAPSTASAVERIADAYPPERQAQIRVQLADVLRIVIAQRLLPHARTAGRAVALEILRVNHAVGSAIREGKTPQIPGIIQSSRRDGMLPLERCLADMARGGVITTEVARAVANEPVSLESYLRGTTTGP